MVVRLYIHNRITYGGRLRPAGLAHAMLWRARSSQSLVGWNLEKNKLDTAFGHQFFSFLLNVRSRIALVLTQFCAKYVRLPHF